MLDVPLEISVREVAARLGSGDRVRLIDVRNPDEFEHCRLDGAELIPLPTLPSDASTKLADKSAEILVYCHHGMRSLRAVGQLRALGYANARSMTGGIDLWSEEVDPAVPRY